MQFIGIGMADDNWWLENYFKYTVLFLKSRKNMGKLTPREHIINIAIELFREHSYHATGVDRIINEVGVSIKTLYRYFRSKEELLIDRTDTEIGCLLEFNQKSLNCLGGVFS